jgi:RHS repeat-associated protein
VGSYFPYGVERAASRENDVKFATYHRDTTGLDYANQRYYDSRMGRFLSPDPYVASGGPADPGSWNRYAYVQGDPINYKDPRGLFKSTADPDDDMNEGEKETNSCVINGVEITDPLMCISIQLGSMPLPDLNQVLWAAMKSTTSTLSPFLYAKLGSLFGTSCDAAFGSDTEYDLSEDAMYLAAGKVTIWDIGGQESDLKLSDATGQVTSPDPTIRAYFDGVTGVAFWVSGPAIFVSGSFYSDKVLGETSAGYKGTALLHELLHFMTGLNDSGMAKHFGVPLPANATEDDASRAWGKWLKNGCLN